MALAFWLLAAASVLGALGVVVLRQPIHCALSLLLTLVSVGGLFILNHAEFLFAVQLLVYAGGIMVLFLFTIMLVNVKRSASEPFLTRQTGVAILAGALLLVVVGGAVVGDLRTSALAGGPPAVSAAPAPSAATGLGGNAQAVSWGLYRDYLLPFEIASVFLLVAMIGAVVLGKRTMEKVD